MFPLGSVLLPGERLPLRIFEPRYRAMLADATSAENTVPAGFGVVLIARGHEVGGGEVRTDIGTFADIAGIAADEIPVAPDVAALSIVATGSFRFRVRQWLDDDPYPQALIQPLPEPAVDAAATSALIETGAAIRALIEDSFRRRDSPIGDGVPLFDAADLADVGVFGWAARLPFGPADRQALLAAESVTERASVLDDAVQTLAARIHFGG